MNDTDVAWSVQKAIVGALMDIRVPGETTGSVGVPVYDHAPENKPLPFVVIGRHEVTPGSTYDDPTVERHEVTLDVWSQYRGRRQVLAILAAIRERLHHEKPALDGAKCVLCRVAQSLADRDPEQPVTYQGRARIEILASQEVD